MEKKKIQNNVDNVPYYFVYLGIVEVTNVTNQKKSPYNYMYGDFKKWRRLTLPPSKGQYHQRNQS